MLIDDAVAVDAPAHEQLMAKAAAEGIGPNFDERA
jgi:hypothetical protein